MKLWKNNIPHRSILVVPANNMHMARKAAETNADVIMLDLEDAISPADKDTARKTLLSILDEIDFKNKSISVRINGINTPYGIEDLDILKKHSKVGSIAIPKVEEAAELKKIHEIAPSKTLWVGFESPKGIFNIRDILRNSENLNIEALVFGNNDYAKEMGLPSNNPMSHPRGEVVLAARSLGCMVFDGPSTNLFQQSLADGDDIKQHAEHARELGFDGLMAIHPAQIGIINKAFSPTAAEIASAKKIVETTGDANRGAVAVDGKMVEDLHVRRALEVIAMDTAIRGNGSIQQK